MKKVKPIKKEKAKKVILIVLFCVAVIVAADFILGFSGHGNINGVKERYESSEIYSEDELKESFIVVKEYFKDNFTGCKLTDIWYDESLNINTADNWKKQYSADNVIVLLSNFKTGDKLSENLEPNSTYSKWQWVLIKNDGDKKWKVATCGY